MFLIMCRWLFILRVGWRILSIWGFVSIIREETRSLRRRKRRKRRGLRARKKPEIYGLLNQDKTPTKAEESPSSTKSTNSTQSWNNPQPNPPTPNKKNSKPPQPPPTSQPKSTPKTHKHKSALSSSKCTSIDPFYIITENLTSATTCWLLTSTG